MDTNSMNRIPTGGYAIGFTTVIFYGWLSDRLGRRLEVAAGISVIAFLSCLLLTLASSRSVIYAGYLLNAACWGYGPVALVREMLYHGCYIDH
jgi:MFS transporter, ACS family, pantothenate transporter